MGVGSGGCSDQRVSWPAVAVLSRCLGLLVLMNSECRGPTSGVFIGGVASGGSAQQVLRPGGLVVSRCCGQAAGAFTGIAASDNSDQ